MQGSFETLLARVPMLLATASTEECIEVSLHHAFQAFKFVGLDALPCEMLSFIRVANSGLADRELQTLLNLCGPDKVSSCSAVC